MVMHVTAPTGTPAFLAKSAAARFWPSRVIANHRSAGTLGACERAIRELVLHGLATVRTRTSGPAASLIALPWPVKSGLLPRTGAGRDCPSFRGQPPTRVTQWAP